MAGNTYKVEARRVGNWWALDVPEVDVHTQAKRLDLAPDVAREAIALTLDVEESGVDVEVVPALAADLRRMVERAVTARRDADAHSLIAIDTNSLVARQLQGAGLTLRDIAVMLGVSHQRVHQLVAKTEAKTRARKATAATNSRVVSTPKSSKTTKIAAKRKARA